MFWIRLWHLLSWKKEGSTTIKYKICISYVVCRWHHQIRIIVTSAIVIYKIKTKSIWPKYSTKIESSWNKSALTKYFIRGVYHPHPNSCCWDTWSIWLFSHIHNQKWIHKQTIYKIKTKSIRQESNSLEDLLERLSIWEKCMPM